MLSLGFLLRLLCSGLRPRFSRTLLISTAELVGDGGYLDCGGAQVLEWFVPSVACCCQEFTVWVVVVGCFGGFHLWVEGGYLCGVAFSADPECSVWWEYVEVEFVWCGSFR